MHWIEAVGLKMDEGASRVVACAWVTEMSAPACNGFVGLVAADASAGGGFVGLVAMKMQASAGGWQASAGIDDDGGWPMECERRLADGERGASAGGDDDASVSWQMECKRWLVDGERRLADGVRASAGGWQAMAAMMM